GEPEKSPMLRAVLRTEKLKMPPKERNKLSDVEVETLRQWIAAGARWVESPKSAGESKPKWEYKPEDIWAFQPLTKPAVPQIENALSKIQNPIDSFVQVKLNEKNLKPAPPAD